MAAKTTLHDLLSLWEQAGGKVAVEELCRDTPELLGEVRSAIEKLRKINHALTATSVTFEAPTLRPLEQVGQYRIVELIAEGGMGAVYRAEQQRPRRQVALKLIRSNVITDSLLRRFEREADVLAMLNHPNVAKVYEAAVADSPIGEIPFYAMELVDGVPANQYFEAVKLSRDDKVRLLIKICNAVQHAHGKGVIHRDLKPSNILVTSDGEPKVLDFGIARVINSDIGAAHSLMTQSGAIIGTLAYMSPEQAAGKLSEVDATSDVYALGVIAYELLTGRLPVQISNQPIHEAVRAIHEEAPPRPATILGALRGDLETVILKAIEKQRSDRYRTADAFSDDLQRALQHEPISARRRSTWYQVRQFTKRNRTLVAGAVAAITLLVLGLTGTSIGFYRERIQRAVAEDARESVAVARRTAEENFKVADRVSSFLVGMFESATPAAARGKPILASDVVERAAADLMTMQSDNDSVRAALQTALGSVLSSLGKYADAEKLLLPALAYRRSQGLTSPEYLDTLSVLGAVTHSLGREKEGLLQMKEAFDGRVAVLGTEHPDTLRTMVEYARSLERAGDVTAAGALYERALFICRSTQPGDSDLMLNILNGYAYFLYASGQLGAAESLLHELVEAREKRLGKLHPDTITALVDYATVLQHSGEPQKAEPLLKLGWDRSRQVFGEEHIDTISAMNNYATGLVHLNRLSEAEP